MASGSFRFDRFVLDCRNRQLKCDGAAVELNARYLDALALLVREQGRLVSKERFLAEVWRGVPVTDEALTQCIRTLRRQLGDSATAPRFIETVPKHCYRFCAPVMSKDAQDPPAAARQRDRARDVPLLGAAGTLGAGLAGTIGGLFYGLVGASQALQPGTGALSALLVLMCITILVALIGGAGVAFGIAAARLAPGPPFRWSVVGGALGGLAVGAFVKLLGLDAFAFLLGHTPGDITGAGEGAALGAAVGLGFWLAHRAPVLRTRRRAVLAAAAIGGGAGILIPLLGGRLMSGSLDLLARSFPGSRLRLDGIGALLGENGFGPVSQAVTGALEGALFAGCIVGAMLLAARALR